MVHLLHYYNTKMPFQIQVIILFHDLENILFNKKIVDKNAIISSILSTIQQINSISVKLFLIFN